MKKPEVRLKLFDLRLEQQELRRKYNKDDLGKEIKNEIYKRLKEIDYEIEKNKHAYGRQHYSKVEGSRKI